MGKKMVAKQEYGYKALLPYGHRNALRWSRLRLALFDGAINESQQVFKQQIRRSIGLAAKPRVVQTASRQVLRPFPGPTVAAYSLT